LSATDSSLLQVGLANVGKSTLFQAITKCSLGNPANFPYATIDPEEARVLVPDARYDWLCEHYQPKSRVPANLTVYDIAGLTRGSSTGAGLGNAFLSHIRAVDAIFQVVRCFDDAEIIHVEGDVNPTRDLDIISEELRLKDIEFVEKAKENLAKQTRRGGQSLEMKKLKEEEATVDKILQLLKDGKDVRKADWGPKEVGSVSFLSPFCYHDEQEQYARHNPSSSTAASHKSHVRGCYERKSNPDTATIVSMSIPFQLVEFDADSQQ
jgi:obg-like ATPase 1